MSELFDRILKVVDLISIVDVIDILLVTVAVYGLILLIKETRAATLIKGIIVLIIVLQLSSWWQLNTVNFILQNTMQLGFFALLVVFQPELRRGLELMGRSKLTSVDLFNFDAATQEAEIKSAIEQICAAVTSMSGSKTGALIAIERDTKIGDIANTGTALDARITSQIIENIFFKNTPLHDGAAIIRGVRVLAAGCFLPISQQQGISKELGTRHRAALGLSEMSDAIVIIVSEETGKISVARDGVLTRNLTPKALDTILSKELVPKRNAVKKKFKFWKVKDDEK